MDSLTLKRHSFFQNKNNTKVTQFRFQISDFSVSTRSFKTQQYLSELEFPKN